MLTHRGLVGQKARVESDMQDLLSEPLIQIVLQFLRLATTERMPADWQAVVDLLLELRGDYCGRGSHLNMTLRAT